MTEDPSSLERLQDIVTPGPEPSWPPTPGWVVLATLAMAAALFAGLRAWRRHHHNAYRREARRELERIREAGPTPLAVSTLLKRVALATWPRREVAGLDGERWMAWIDDATNTLMPPGAAKALREAFANPAAPAPPELLDYAAEWIDRHREGPRC